MLQMDIETALAPPPEPAGPDWAKVKIDFEAGAASVREIARRAGVSHTAVLKRANAEAWKAAAPSALPGFQSQVETKLETKPDDDFDWNDLNNDEVLVWDRPALAIYRCATGQILLRAEARDPRDEDACIRLDPRDVPALIRRLQEIAR